MRTRSKLAFACYGVGVILFFSFVGFYLSAHEEGEIPTSVEWIGMPGVLLAAFCLVGLHSDYFILASILANIGVYLLIPWLICKMFTFWSKRFSINS